MGRPIQSDGRVHGVVAAIRREDGRWLCVRRSRNVIAPLKVCFPGGAVEVGESHDDAIVREIREELGIDIVPIRKCWRWEHPANPLTLWGYIANMPTDQQVKPEPAEIEEVLWLSCEEILAHPEGLPSNQDFVACLMRECGCGRQSDLRVREPEM